MKNRLTYAMVGGAEGSFIGPIHRGAIRLDDLADLVAGNFSRNEAKNKLTGRHLGLDPKRVYADWQDLVAAEKGRIDFLVVCTPNDSHFAIAKAALEAGMNVMCEKPLSLTRKEAETLERIAKRRRLVVGVPFSYAAMPMVKLARDLVKKGLLGKICKVHLEYVQGSFRRIDPKDAADLRNRWKMNPKIAGPSCVVADIGVHGANLIETVTGLEISSVLADFSSYTTSKALEDDASIIMRLGKPTDGAKAVLVTSKIATGEENGVRLRVYGDKASLYWNQEEGNYLHVKLPFEPERIYKRNAPYVRDLSAVSKRLSRIPAGHHEGFIEAFSNLYLEFCAAVRGEKDRDFTGAHEGVRTMRFVDAVRKSAKAGSRWTKV